MLPGLQDIQTYKGEGVAAKHFSWDLKGQGPVWDGKSSLGWISTACLTSDKNSLYGQSATKWLVAYVRQSIIYQAIYKPFLCLKMLGTRGLLEHYWKELLQ